MILVFGQDQNEDGNSQTKTQKKTVSTLKTVRSLFQFGLIYDADCCTGDFLYVG